MVVMLTTYIKVHYNCFDLFSSAGLTPQICQSQIEKSTTKLAMVILTKAFIIVSIAVFPTFGAPIQFSQDELIPREPIFDNTRAKISGIAQSPTVQHVASLTTSLMSAFGGSKIARVGIVGNALLGGWTFAPCQDVVLNLRE